MLEVAGGRRTIDDFQSLLEGAPRERAGDGPGPACTRQTSATDPTSANGRSKQRLGHLRNHPVCSRLGLPAREAALLALAAAEAQACHLWGIAAVLPTLESVVMRVLLTNDDGIGADGPQRPRAAPCAKSRRRGHVIAPDSNRSATARSITTRSPLWVEEIEFDDGSSGYATDGTPVDCVRFAELGLVGERPELIVSGINHGSNLGDDITYSGTVAAALEGIVLGIPAIAVSQQSARGRWTSARRRL